MEGEASFFGVDTAEMWTIESRGMAWHRSRPALFPVWSSWKGHAVGADQLTELAALGTPSTCECCVVITRVSGSQRESWCCMPYNPDADPSAPPKRFEAAFTLIQEL